jgi:YD repeat-containing protein
VGNKRFVYDNKGNKTEFVYDPLNRLVLTILPEGNTVETKYDENGNKAQERDGKHNGNDYVYDALNRVSKVTNADGKDTSFWYNEEGKLTKQVSATGLVTKFYLNEIGLPLRVVDSLNQTRYFDYDVVGNSIYKKDPRGTETRFEYDDLYRVLKADLQNGNRHQYLSYEYDLVGNVKKASNGQVDLVYNTYNGNYQTAPFNRIGKVEQVMPDGSRYATEYRYDQIGQMTGIKYPNSSEWLDYQYD